MSSNESLADRIRRFSLRNFVRPALKAKTSEVRIRAGDVHTAMHLRDRMPAVCAALRSHKFADFADLSLLRQEGPNQGANAIFIFGQKIARSERPRRSSDAVNKQTPKMPIQTKERRIRNGQGTMFLVSCVKTKQSSKAPAKDLYASDWFSKARTVVESKGAPWFILSAKYGLVSPKDIIAPYELTLNKMPVADRRRWAEEVLGKIGRMATKPKRIVMFAGARYREFLQPGLEAMGIEVDVPMVGLAFGEQLSWLGQQA